MRDESADVFLRISLHRMTDHYHPKLVECLQRLTKVELWQSDESSNSIGGIVLHICKHIERTHNKYLDSRVDTDKEGIENYFPDHHEIEPEKLIHIVKESIEKWERLLTHLLDNKEQSFDMHSMYHVVEHFGYHLGQIVDRVQRISKQPFQFCQRGINERNLRRSIEGE